MKKIIILSLVIFTAKISVAQNIDAFLEGGVQNANALLGNYLEPAFAGFGYAMNSGWYNTGKTHKPFGFDITVGPAFALIPTNKQFFTFDPSQYSNIGIAMPENPNSPYRDRLTTLFGPNLNADDIPYLVFNQGTPDEIRVTAPTGLGLEEVLPTPAAVPGAYAQIGIGLFKNTDLKIRFMPEQSTDDFSAKMFGLGVMHDVKQWIPGLKKLPFDLSGFFAFNTMSTTISISENNPDQLMSFDIRGTTLQGVISKKLSILTVYGGLGYLSSKTNFKMLGDYEVTNGTTFSDPINFSSNNGSMRANVGARLKILILTISAEYAVQEYNTVTAGVGISIR